MSKPLTENHNDLYKIEVQFEVVIGLLEQAKKSVGFSARTNRFVKMLVVSF